jgi:hypothetical protein
LEGGCDCPRQQGFARSRRAVEKNTFRWCDAHADEEFGVQKWKFDDLVERILELGGLICCQETLYFTKLPYLFTQASDTGK